MQQLPAPVPGACSLWMHQRYLRLLLWSHPVHCRPAPRPSPTLPGSQTQRLQATPQSDQSALRSPNRPPSRPPSRLCNKPRPIPTCLPRVRPARLQAARSPKVVRPPLLPRWKFLPPRGMPMPTTRSASSISTDVASHRMRPWPSPTCVLPPTPGMRAPGLHSRPSTAPRICPCRSVGR